MAFASACARTALVAAMHKGGGDKTLIDLLFSLILTVERLAIKPFRSDYRLFVPDVTQSVKASKATDEAVRSIAIACRKAEECDVAHIEFRSSTDRADAARAAYFVAKAAPKGNIDDLNDADDARDRAAKAAATYAAARTAETQAKAAVKAAAKAAELAAELAAAKAHAALGDASRIYDVFQSGIADISSQTSALLDHIRKTHPTSHKANKFTLIELFAISIQAISRVISYGPELSRLDQRTTRRRHDIDEMINDDIIDATNAVANVAVATASDTDTDRAASCAKQRVDYSTLRKLMEGAHYQAPVPAAWFFRDELRTVAHSPTGIGGNLRRRSRVGNLSNIDFDALENIHPEFSGEWKALRSWVSRHPTADFIDLSSLLRDLSSIDKIDVIIALQIMEDNNMIKTVYRFKTPDGRILDRNYPEPDKVPKSMRDQDRKRLIRRADGEVICGYRWRAADARA